MKQFWQFLTFLFCLLFIIIIRSAHYILTSPSQPLQPPTSNQDPKITIVNENKSPHFSSTGLDTSKSGISASISTGVNGNVPQNPQVVDSGDPLQQIFKKISTFLSAKPMVLDYLDGENDISVDNQIHHVAKKASIIWPVCNESEWCSIPMPKKSLFKFAPPSDPYKWRIAQVQAANGDHVLLSKVFNHFKNPFEFIDGDINFRSLHYTPDLFVDTSKRDMKQLLPDFQNRRLANQEPRDTRYPWEKTGVNVIPDKNYNFRKAKRAPIFKYGYHAFDHQAGNMYTGKMIGEAYGGRNDLYKMWLEVKDKLDTPFIMLHAQNENWGLLSTLFPNRTVDWGRCCDDPLDKQYLMQFLDHNMTLMVLINQHTNITHPKLLVIPRGVPGPDEFSRKMIWDVMRNNLLYEKKGVLLFTATSSWGPRPQIIKCVSNKFKPDEFYGQFADAPGEKTAKAKPRMDKVDYYAKLGSAKFCLAVAGLGYDTFRLWESMAMGVIPVLEQNIGFDRMLWRLPALLVEDYDLVTPSLLRVAYIEALYRADEFEYERLTQRFWNDFIFNVSAQRSAKPLYDLFPVSAEDTGFARPAVPYDCGKDGSKCGPGTKRTPRSSC
eukprot:gene10741-14426_t